MVHFNNCRQIGLPLCRIRGQVWWGGWRNQSNTTFQTWQICSNFNRICDVIIFIIDESVPTVKLWIPAELWFCPTSNLRRCPEKPSEAQWIWSTEKLEKSWNKRISGSFPLTLWSLHQWILNNIFPFINWQKVLCNFAKNLLFTWKQFVLCFKWYCYCRTNYCLQYWLLSILYKVKASNDFK